MKIRALTVLDRALHALSPGWMPWHNWAFRVCVAYERAVDER